jgi:hypothetical protein
MDTSVTAEIAASAARLVVEEGLDYGQARRKAARTLGVPGGRGVAMPSNEAIEEEVRTHIQIFCADEQAQDLRVMRTLALQWMKRLADFRPHLAGAAWRGTANRLSALHIDLYCDDPKSAEIALINLGVDFDTGALPDGHGGEFPVLRLASRVSEWREPVTVLLFVHDHDDLRGALKPDSRGQAWRGDAVAVARTMAATGPAAAQP